MIRRVWRWLRLRPALAAYLTLAAAVIGGVWRVESIADEAHRTAERVEAQAAAVEMRECRATARHRVEIRTALVDDFASELGSALGAPAGRVDEFKADLAGRLDRTLPDIDCEHP